MQADAALGWNSWWMREQFLLVPEPCAGEGPPVPSGEAGPNRKPKYACMLAGVICSKNEREMRDVHEFPAIFAY